MKLIPALATTVLLGAGTPPPAQDLDPRALMIQARSLQHEGGGDDPQGAVAVYRKLVAAVPGSSQAWLRLSGAMVESGNMAGAVDPAVKATELDPSSGEAWAHLGLLYYIQSQTKESFRPLTVSTLRHAVRLLPGDAELWTRLAETLDRQRDAEGAMKAWLSVGRLHPGATYSGRVLADYAWERAMELAIQLRNYDARREAVLALCDRTSVEQRYLKYLEDLATDQVEAGFLGHAEESFQILGQYMPLEPAIWENVAMIQLRTSRFEEALDTLGRAEALRKSSRTSFQAGLCLMKLGNLAQAEARWKALLPALGGSEEDKALAPSAKVLYASCLLLSGRPKAMLELAAPWPEADDNGELVSLRAQALIQTGDWKQARTVLRDGIQRFPGEELFQHAAALPPKLFEEGRFFKSESRNALVQLNLESMASLWATFRSWNHCLEAAQEARKAAPVRDVELLLLQANALENLGRSDEAIRVLREGQKLNPDHPVLQNNLGFSLLEHGGDLDEAARLIRTALDKDPKNGSAMDSWGWVLFKQGKFKEAESALRRATELSPYSPEAHQHLGEALLKLDRLQDALDEWERALAYAFPQRKELEQQAQALRVRLARSNPENQGGPGPDEPGDGAPDDTEEAD
jgi:tetratricopeptide (TPR) repeat protein